MKGIYLNTAILAENDSFLIKKTSYKIERDKAYDILIK